MELFNSLTKVLDGPSDSRFDVNWIRAILFAVSCFYTAQLSASPQPLMMDRGSTFTQFDLLPHVVYVADPTGSLTVDQLPAMDAKFAPV
ncbi:MAG: hypothetical protein M3Q07_17995, partial [Pseudobdellovibrionaceae bacterium]|nr:hypothetical protein [Pseudobdellovibrionaceae bacterium]